MDARARLVPVVRRVLVTARRFGVPHVARALPDHEIDSYAYAISHVVGARAWLLRRRAPRWRRIEAGWQRAVGDEAVRDGLAGTLDARDEVRLVTDGVEAFAERSALYAAARERVDVSTYYIQADETGRRTAGELAACVARGVAVRLIVDAYMTDRKRREVAGMDDLFGELSRAGIQLRFWRDPGRPFDSNHRKIMLIDGAVAVVGGRNLADHYRVGAWRDVDLVLRGPTAARLQPLFESVWRSAAPRAEPDAYRPWFDHVPARIEADPSMRYVLACVGAARQTVDAELAYFVGQDVLCRALAGAVARGVRVRLLTNAADATDLPFVNYAAYAGMRRLLDAGAHVFVRRGRGRTVHSKFVVTDTEWVAFGSHNLDYYASRFCCETGLHVRDARLATHLGRFFEAGLADATPIGRREVEEVLARERAMRFWDQAFRDFQ